MQCRGVAKEREIGREIQRVEIDAPVGQPLRRQAHRVEAQDWRRFRQRRRKLPDQPLRVERGDEDRARTANRQVDYRAGAMAEQLDADSGDILDIYRFDLHPAKAEDLAEPGSRAVRIDNRDRTALFQRSDQRARRGRRMRVRQRLVQRVAAANVVEGLDAQSHSGTLHRDAAGRSTGSVIRLEAARSGQPQQRFQDCA